MELGKVQKAWVSDLRKYPERQDDGRLGKVIKLKDGYHIRCCCLGQAEITMNGMPKGTSICSGGSSFGLEGSYKQLGLHSMMGVFQGGLLEGHDSLANANDGGVTWEVIANFIEKNPEVVFIKSL
jgi:hypothetical protein